jgi:hypothetical protein
MAFLCTVGHNSLGRGSGRGRGASGQPPAAQMSAAGEYIENPRSSSRAHKEQRAVIKWLQASPEQSLYSMDQISIKKTLNVVFSGV